MKNPDYFVKDRPYLDGLQVRRHRRAGHARRRRSSRVSSTSPFPGETTKTAAEQLKKAVPQLVVTPVGTSVTDNIIMNEKKPPFDNVKVRLAVSYAIDRAALIRACTRAARCRRRAMHAEALRRLGPARQGPGGAARATASRPT